MNPIAVVVNVEINPDRMDEFIKLIEEDAVGSRAEPGCLRFDVLKSKEPNKFTFYEVYKDADSVTYHKTMPHYIAWTDFKASGGAVSSVSAVSEAIFYSDPVK